MLRQIELTCQNIIKHSKTFREELCNKILLFTFEGTNWIEHLGIAGPNKSSRTSDVIKSVKVLTAQFLCLTRMENWQQYLPDKYKNMNIFKDKSEFLNIKKQFVRYAFEEEHRRHHSSSAKEYVDDKENLLYLLMPDHKKFLYSVMERRK